MIVFCKLLDVIEDLPLRGFCPEEEEIKENRV